VHRIGRTARAEASGRASSFASPEEHELLRGIERFTRKPVERAAVPREHDAFRSEVKRVADLPPAARHPHQQHRRQPSRHGQAQPHAGRHHPAQSHPTKEPGTKVGSWRPRRRR